MRTARDIIYSPIISEKASHQTEKYPNKVALKVAPDANKVEIKLAVQEIWEVKVLSVNTLKFKGKEKRVGRYAGRRPSWKKAVITLAEGNTINFFEGQ